MLCFCFVENTAYNYIVKIQEFTEKRYEAKKQRNKIFKGGILVHPCFERISYKGHWLHTTDMNSN